MKRSVWFLGENGPTEARMAAALAAQLLPAGTRVGVVDDPQDRRTPEVGSALEEVGLAHEVARSAGPVWDNATDLLINLGRGETPASVPGPVRYEHWQTVSPRGDDAVSLFEAARSNRDRLLLHLEALARSFALEPAIGVIGGSGFYDMPGLSDVEELDVETPFGTPSGPLVTGRLFGKRVVFLARHARGHTLLPSEVNARANIYALKRAGVTQVLSVSAVGSLREAIAPGHLVLPRQFIDRTVGRPATFFGKGAVAHVSLAEPTCTRLGDLLAQAAKETGTTLHADGTYICIEGPQFSTRAESHLFRSWGADVIGMTNLPEARLAREAELCYVTLALPTDYDCWRTASEEVRVADVMGQLRANVELARRVVAQAIESMAAAPECACGKVLDSALVTPPDQIAPAAHVRLHALISRVRSQRAPQTGVL